MLPLSSLCKLEHLTLQQSSFEHPTVHLSNPICKDPNYTTAMSDIFPTLHWLDREVVKDGAPGKKFYDRCRAIEGNGPQESSNIDYEAMSNFFCYVPMCISDCIHCPQICMIPRIHSKLSSKLIKKMKRRFNVMQKSRMVPIQLS